MTLRISPSGTRGAQVPTHGIQAALFKSFTRLQIWVYRHSGDKRLSSMMGFPVVLVTTRGAKSGQPRTALVGGFAEGDDAWLVAATLNGAARHPAWFLNMAKHPTDIWLEVGKERFRVGAELLEEPERSAALDRIAAIAPRYGTYQEKTDREIPIVRLTRLS